MTYDTIIFDFGNVINRWEPAAALADLFPDAEQAELAMDRLGFKQWVGDVLDAGGDVEASLAAIKDVSLERYALLTTYMSKIGLAHSIAVEGTIDLIQRLADEKYRLLGMTNAGLAAYDALERQFPIIDLMSDVFVSAREKCMKPQAEAFERLLNRNNLQPQQCVFVDDAPRNVSGAEACGIRSLLFSSAAQLEVDLLAMGVLKSMVLK